MKRRGAEDAEVAEVMLRRELSVRANRLTGEIIGAAVEVHRELGPGFLENIYEMSLAIELEQRHIEFERQVRVPTVYKGRFIGESRLDLVVEGEIVVELKAVTQLTPLHAQQVLSYLKAGAFEIGLLINFNVPRLRDGIRRVISTG